MSRQLFHAKAQRYLRGRRIWRSRFFNNARVNIMHETWHEDANQTPTS
jgi:hypothetical protein